MIKLLQKTFQNKKVKSIQKHPRFVNDLSKVRIEFGEYSRTRGVDRDFSILFNSNLKYKVYLENVSIRFDKNNNVVLSGKDVKTKQFFFLKIPSETIEWRHFQISNVLEPCVNGFLVKDNQFNLDIQLKGKNSYLIYCDH